MARACHDVNLYRWGRGDNCADIYSEKISSQRRAPAAVTFKHRFSIRRTKAAAEQRSENASLGKISAHEMGDMWLDQLPTELLIETALSADYDSTLALCLASKRAANLCKSGNFWKEKLQARYPNFGSDYLFPDYRQVYRTVERWDGEPGIEGLLEAQDMAERTQALDDQIAEDPEIKLLSQELEDTEEEIEDNLKRIRQSDAVRFSRRGGRYRVQAESRDGRDLLKLHQTLRRKAEELKVRLDNAVESYTDKIAELSEEIRLKLAAVRRKNPRLFEPQRTYLEIWVSEGLTPPLRDILERRDMDELEEFLKSTGTSQWNLRVGNLLGFHTTSDRPELLAQVIPSYFGNPISPSLIAWEDTDEDSEEDLPHEEEEDEQDPDSAGDGQSIESLGYSRLGSSRPRWRSDVSLYDLPF